MLFRSSPRTSRPFRRLPNWRPEQMQDPWVSTAWQKFRRTASLCRVSAYTRLTSPPHRRSPRQMNAVEGRQHPVDHRWISTVEGHGVAKRRCLRRLIRAPLERDAATKEKHVRKTDDLLVEGDGVGSDRQQKEHDLAMRRALQLENAFRTKASAFPSREIAKHRVADPVLLQAVILLKITAPRHDPALRMRAQG